MCSKSRPFLILGKKVPVLLVLTLALLVVLSAAPWAAAARARKINVEPPTGITVTRYGDAFLVDWNPVEDPAVAGYNVYRTYHTCSRFICWGRLNTSIVSGTSYLDTSVCIWWLRQYYWVAAVDACGRILSLSDPVAVCPCIPDTSPPAPPSGIEAGALEQGVSITWDYANAEPDFAGYNVYTCTGGAGSPLKLNPAPLLDDFLYWQGGTAGDTFAVCSVDTVGNESAPDAVAALELPEYVMEFELPAAYPFSSIDYDGLWGREVYADAHGGQIWVSPEAGASVQVCFNGRSVKLVTSRFWQCGWCEVYVDGMSRGTVNLFYDNLDSYEADMGFVAFADYSLRPGNHTLELVNLGIPGLEKLPDWWLPGYEVPHFINVDCLLVR
jgi:hypothetical protein